MRTSMNIPDKLLKEAKEVSGLDTMTQTVILALNEFIQRRKARKILELKGTMKEDYDYKALRKKR